MERVPKSLRLHIGIFGRANVGKSSLLNLIAGQDVAITSSIPGTTTDVVEKVMELLPIGPVVFLDTAGLDDISQLAKLRIEKTKKIFERAEVIFLVVESGIWGKYEDVVVLEAKQRNTPIIIIVNKIDLQQPNNEFIDKIKSVSPNFILCSSIDYDKRNVSVTAIKAALKSVLPEDYLNRPALIGDLVDPDGFAVLIVPVDMEAPKGRLILPQVQTIRDLLDNDAAAVVVKESEYVKILANFKNPPDIVVCDSQVVDQMVKDTPKHIKCTTFSILFSRFKGDLIEMVKGVRVIDRLSSGDKILIAESCSHHAIDDDIGRVKIPKWLSKFTGIDLKIEVCAGHDYPEDLTQYKLIIQCGGCMVNRKEVLHRIDLARKQGVAITNYGVCISYLQGVLSRVLEPFKFSA